MKNPKNKKLSLKSESLRALATDDLGQIQGGAVLNGTSFREVCDPPPPLTITTK